MSNDNKTLADVQPGGRVRLGDQADRAQFEAWAKGQGYNLEWRHEGYVHRSSQIAYHAWKAALSAQPSPGGRDALPQLPDTDWNARSDGSEPLYSAEQMHDYARAVLAARQPVGEPVGYFDPDVLAHLTEELIDPVGVLRRKPNGKSNVPVWLGPPAQAVDLGQLHAKLRDAVKLMDAGFEDEAGEVTREALALIDSQAVGNG